MKTICVLSYYEEAHRNGVSTYVSFLVDYLSKTGNELYWVLLGADFYDLNVGSIFQTKT